MKSAMQHVVAALTDVFPGEQGKETGLKVALNTAEYAPVASLFTLGKKIAPTSFSDLENATSMSQDEVAALKFTCSSSRPLPPTEYGIWGAAAVKQTLEAVAPTAVEYCPEAHKAQPDEDERPGLEE